MRSGAGVDFLEEPPGRVLSLEAEVQLATAVDGERPDEPALYPLLLDMRAWSATEVAAAGRAAAITDYAGFFRGPDARRGEVAVLQGRFAGRVREVELLRGGPWGRKVTEWGLVADGPKDDAGRVAVVYFAGKVARPRDRQRVRVVGRFFKLWTDVDAAGAETTYPVFVAAPYWEPVGGAAPGAGWRVMVVLVLGLAAAFWSVRRALALARPAVRPVAVRPRLRSDPGPGDAGEPALLPGDPAEALGVLHERREQAEAGWASGD